MRQVLGWGLARSPAHAAERGRQVRVLPGPFTTGGYVCASWVVRGYGGRR
jgi:hypothetical protein